MLTTLQNKIRHKKLSQIYALRKPRKKLRPSRRPPHLQSKHEQRVIRIALKRYDTSTGYWPYEALLALVSLGVESANEYIKILLTHVNTSIKMMNEAPQHRGKLPISPKEQYNQWPPELKYYHGIPNNISFQKLMASLGQSGK